MVVILYLAVNATFLIYVVTDSPTGGILQGPALCAGLCVSGSWTELGVVVGIGG